MAIKIWSQKIIGNLGPRKSQALAAVGSNNFDILHIGHFVPPIFVDNRKMSKTVVIACVIREEIYHTDSELEGDFFKGANGRLGEAPFNLAKEALGKVGLLGKLFESEVSLSPFLSNSLPQIFHLKQSPPSIWKKVSKEELMQNI